MASHYIMLGKRETKARAYCLLFVMVGLAVPGGEYGWMI